MVFSRLRTTRLCRLTVASCNAAEYAGKPHASVRAKAEWLVYPTTLLVGAARR
jgi:hypothetical protein